jgi:hypothetical protein
LKEIEASTLQNTKLSLTRDDLLKEVLKLSQKSIDLINKNESLSRSIAEKENHISAFMYNDQQQKQQQSRPVIGVTLVDQPYTLPLAPVVDESLNTFFTSSVSSSSYNNNDNTGHSNNNSSNANKPLPTTITTTTSTAPKKENQPGIFRQISLRLSSRKRRQQDDSSNSNAAPLNISEPINTTAPNGNNIIPFVSSSEPLLHPAAVVTSPSSSTPSSSHLQQQDNSTPDSNKRKKSEFLIRYITLYCLLISNRFSIWK